MKSAAPFIAVGGAVVAIVVGVLVFGDQLGLSWNSKPSEQPVSVSSEEAAPQAPEEKDATAEEGSAEEATAPETDVVSEPDEAANTETVREDVAVSKPDEPAQEPEVAEAEEPQPIEPSFDVVRVEPDGQTLVAGRANPGWTVELKEGDQVLSTAEADANGDWVMLLEQALKQGVSELSLSATSNDGAMSIRSKSNVTVARPDNDDGELLVVESKPGEATRVLANSPSPKEGATDAPSTMQAPSDSEGAAPAADTDVAETAPVVSEQGTASAEAQDDIAVARVEQPAEQAEVTQESDTAAAVEPEPGVESTVSIEAVEIEGDTLFVAGAAVPEGSSVRLYVDNAPITDGTSGEGGRFLFDGKLALDEGSHIARVDLIEPQSGDVVDRAEVSFTKSDGETLQTVGAVAEAQSTDMPGASGASDVLETRKVIIRRGDNLWTIARRVYGAGIRYSTIYDNNNDQIRDPDLIYPGQVFELPQGEIGWETHFEEADPDASGSSDAPAADGANGASG